MMSAMPYKLIAGLLLCCSAHAAELPWDLGYKATLRAHPLANRGSVGEWIGAYPVRPIHQRLAEYKGAPIEASLLIEQAGPHTGDPLATWIIATRDGAQVCGFDKRSTGQICGPLDRARAIAIIRDVAAMPDPPPPDLTKEKTKYGDYFGLLSVYLDGKAMQRPLRRVEWYDEEAAGSGRRDKVQLGDVMARAYLSDEELAKRERESSTSNGSGKK
jgi:hypothetical protein